MSSNNIKVTIEQRDSKLLKPIDVYGAEEGSIFMVVKVSDDYIHSEKNPSYYVGCGTYEYPIYIFYCDDSYTISPIGPSDLEGFHENIFVVPIKGKLEVKLVLE